MNQSPVISAADRNEMLRTFAGLVTAKVAKDPEAVNLQLKAIIRDQAEASHGDLEAFATRMAKQVAAGAIVARAILKSLAPRRELSEAEAQRVWAEIYSSDDFVAD